MVTIQALMVILFLHTVPPLTVDTIMEALQGVKNLWVLADYLNTPRSKQDKEHKTTNDQLNEMVVCWLRDSPRVSWRELICSLDWAGETVIADRIRTFAEPLRGGLLFHNYPHPQVLCILNGGVPHSVTCDIVDI